MQTNTLYAKSNTIFLKACKIVQQNLPDYKKFKPTARQASEFRVGKGIAYKTYIGDLPKEVRT